MRQAHRACPVCEAEGSRPLFEKAGQRFVACTGCGMVFIDPVPAEAELASIYNDYGDSYFREECKLAIDFTPGSYYRHLGLLGRAGGRGRLLDVGCATGAFLAAAREAGFPDAEGIDISGPSVEHARSLDLKAVAGDFTQGVFAPGSFQVVTMWATLEHLPFPYRFVAEANRVLAPGGLLCVNVPNHDSLTQSILGPKNRYLGGDHLNCFTFQTLRRMLTRAGFQVRIEESCSFNPLMVWKDLRGSPEEQEEHIRDLDNTRKVLSGMNQRAGLAPLRWAYAAFQKLLFHLGKGDNIFVAASKPAAP